MIFSETITNLIQDAAQLIHKSQRIVAFTGAGISTDSGIPDFRSKSSGLWNNIDPMIVASIYEFKRNPHAFYNWIRPLSETILHAKPNPAHQALFHLQEMGLLDAVITQNIDMLHTRAGNHKVYELHGHMRLATCIHCLKEFEASKALNQFISEGILPKCPDCNHVLKPNVILFGEQLPFQELYSAQETARNCDLMLVIGSSLEVAPANEIPLLAHRTGAKVIVVNLDNTDANYYADIVIQGRAAHILPAVLHYLEKLR
jgi:NAD-dependent deacetylase